MTAGGGAQPAPFFAPLRFGRAGREDGRGVASDIMLAWLRRAAERIALVQMPVARLAQDSQTL